LSFHVHFAAGDGAAEFIEDLLTLSNFPQFFERDPPFIAEWQAFDAHQIGYYVWYIGWLVKIESRSEIEGVLVRKNDVQAHQSSIEPRSDDIVLRDPYFGLRALAPLRSLLPRCGPQSRIEAGGRSRRRLGVRFQAQSFIGRACLRRVPAVWKRGGDVVRHEHQNAGFDEILQLDENGQPLLDSTNAPLDLLPHVRIGMPTRWIDRFGDHIEAVVEIVA
jgi:hypothetical protein